MLRLSFRNLLNNKIRFGLTTLSVVLGVTFVVGVFVLTDSLRTTLDELAGDIEGGIDLTVRTTQEFGEDVDRALVPSSLVPRVASIDGVADAIPAILAFNTVITDGDGDAILPTSAPAIGSSYYPPQQFLIDGREPQGPAEFVINADAADDHDLVIGETYDISGPVEQRPFELVGIYNFADPEEDKSLGATGAAFAIDTAQEFLGFDDGFFEIRVDVEANESVANVKQRIADAVGAGYEVADEQERIEETEEDFGQFIDIFANVLLAFALIAVFVSTFVINNTFQIIVGQRIRELGLLRAIGATGRQVFRAVMAEAFLVGVASTIIGIGLGILFGRLLSALFRAAGFTLPSGPIELQPRTLAFAIFVGIVVTVLSSVLPALRAGKISPIAAITSSGRLPPRSLRTRLIVGGILVGFGMLLLALGLFGNFDTAPLLTNIALGAVALFIGVNVLSPAFARPVARLLGRPVQAVYGTTGRLARENAARTPRRTASTAAALMIGLALIGLAGVVGDSIKKTFLETLDNAVEADYFVRSETGNFDPTSGFPVQVAEEIEALPEFDSVVRYRFALDSIRVNGAGKNVFATELATVEGHMDPDVISGDITSVDPRRSILIHKDPAKDLDVSPGDPVAVEFIDGASEVLTVAAIYADSTIFDNWVIDLSTWEEHFARSEIGFVTATIDGFSDDLPEAEQATLLADSRAAIDTVIDRFPSVQAENRVEFRQTQQEQLDSFLVVITGFLIVALIIAVVGIANTLALSVFERTREIGLLRAVGMTRRQTRRMIRWEAAIVAVFGAILGIVLGVLFGIAATTAIPDTFVKSISIPVGTLATYVAVAGVAGLLAAIFPARRASKMDVLEAIAHE